MGLRTTSAIVSRTMRMSNTSRLATLITRRYGLVKVMARGARRPSSRYGAALEPVTHIECTYYEKENRDIQTLSSADIIEPWFTLRDDIALYSVASCMVEIAETHTAPGDPAADLFDLLISSLGELAAGARSDADKYLWCYMLRFLAVAGYRPVIDRCVKCGSAPKGRTGFISFGDGGVLCSCSNPDERYGFRISLGALRVMNDLQNAGPGSIHRLKLPPVQRTEVEEATLRFLSYHSGSSRRPRSLTFLRKMGGLEKTGKIERKNNSK